MKQFNRPMSPHLYSYKPQITSLISIFHRISGFILSFILLFNSFYFIFVSSFVSFKYCFFIIYFFIFIFLFLYYIIFMTIFFHFINGFRHLLWDFCLGLDLKNLTFTGFVVLFGAIFFTFFFTLL